MADLQKPSREVDRPALEAVVFFVPTSQILSLDPE